MSGKIICLPNAKRGLIRCPVNDVIFPQLYRLRGFEFKLKEGQKLHCGLLKSFDDLEASDVPVTASYTLDTETLYARIAHPRSEPITHLTLGEDSGWVIVRHHQSREKLEAYIDGLVDTEAYDGIDDRWLSFETSFGLFTILRRWATRATRDCALIYNTKVMDDQLGQMDWNKVIDSDGKEIDIDDLMPPDVSENYDPIKPFLK